jgi:hypothetical protein
MLKRVFALYAGNLGFWVRLLYVAPVACRCNVRGAFSGVSSVGGNEVLYVVSLATPVVSRGAVKFREQKACKVSQGLAEYEG